MATSTGYIIPPDSDLSQLERYHSPPTTPIVGSYKKPVAARQERCSTYMITGFSASLPSDKHCSVYNIHGSSSRHETKERHCSGRIEPISLARVSQ